MNKKLQTTKPDDFSLTVNLDQPSEGGSHDNNLDITHQSKQAETERESLLAAEREQRLLEESPDRRSRHATTLRLPAAVSDGGGD